MLKSLVKASGIIAGLALSSMVYAVGMGGINVTSALGEPLALEIELVSVDKSDASSMTARLASPDAFKGAGIDYPYDLANLKFKIKTHKDGTPYLSVTSTDPVNDPFVNLLVELDWPAGKLLREYTFLLDPPGYQAAQPKAEAVQPIAPSVASPAPQPKSLAAVPPVEQAPPVVQPLRKTVAAPGHAGGKLVGGNITVKRGDTLTKIARQIEQPDVTLEQMLVALYRANADQFDGRNMNRLRAGKILRKPEDADFSHLSNREAIKVIHVQAADWHAYRQKLAAASSTASEQAPQQEVSGKISTSVADKTPAAGAAAKEVLRLSKGEAPGDKTAGGSVQSMQDKIHALEEEAVARNKELQDSNARIALLEKNIKEMQRLIDLKAQPAVTPPAAAVSKPAVVAPASQPVATAASSVQAAKPVVKPKHKAAPKIAPPPPPPSLLDEFLGNPLYLAGGAAVVLGLGGLAFVAVRRRGQGGKVKARNVLGAAAGGVAGHIAEPELPSPESGDYTQVAAAEGGEAQAQAEPSEEVDPISEAELFLNFGRDAQAEEVLKEALSKDPHNIKVQLKLLGIYADRNDVNAFSSIARQVKDSGDDQAWQQAAAMGRKIDPSNPMYGGGEEGIAEQAAVGEVAGEAAAVTDFVLDEGKDEEPSVLDFDLGSLDMEAGQAEAIGAATEAAPEAVAEPASESAVPAVEAEAEAPAGQATGTEKTVILSPEEMRAAQEVPMDFDVTSTHPDLPALDMEQPAAETRDESALDFDITTPGSTIPATPQGGAPAEKAVAEPSLDDLIFDVTATHPSMPAMEAEVPAEDKSLDIGLGDISLNLDGVAGEKSAAQPAEGARDENWQEVATKLDLAKAYQEMGDAEGAREILEEVLHDGDEQQRTTAQNLIDQLSA